ncbi:MAG: hypothetical protein Q7S65_05910 [Nanoarchaeota archaeon]|nr:hypothetical protein [Nanoarchaeota archaeon]
MLIVKLHYDRGNITLADQVVKYGFAPDRKLQPDSGYRLEALDKKGAVLQSFLFDAPNVFIAEGSDEKGELSGGPVVLQQTDFALVLAYSPQLSSLRIKNTQNAVVGAISLEKGQEFRATKVIAWSLLSLAMILALFAVFRRKKRS